MADNKKNDIKQLSKAQIKQVIITTARNMGVPVDLALALANQESGFNPKALSAAGAIGVMQLKPGTARGLGVNPYDVLENIQGGIKYLAQQLKTFGGDVSKALAAYNAGPGAVQTYNGVPPYKETQKYVKSITNSLPKFKQETTTGLAANITPEEMKTIDERLADVSANMIEQAKEGIKAIASNPYDALMSEYQRARREKEADAAINRIVTQTPINPTQEQITQAQKPFVDASGNIVNLTREGMKQLQEMQAAARYQQYEKALKQAYADQIAALDARNPYTQMGQMAPINYDNYLQALANQEAAIRQQGNLTGLLAADAWMSPNVQDKTKITNRDFAKEAQALTDVARARMEAERAAQLAKQTGLAPQEFIQGGLMDYNTAGNALAAQNAELAAIYQRAMMGDVQAQQFLTNLVTNATGQLNNSATNAANALHQLRADQLAAAKENRERQFAALNYKGGLDPTALAGSNAIQQQNIASGANMYNTGVNAGVNASGNVMDYDVGMAKAQAAAQGAQQGDEFKPITPQQIGSTMLNAAAMSNDPQAFQNAMQGYQNLAAQYGTGIDPRLIYGFTPQNVNTFTPQQQPNQ